MTSIQVQSSRALNVEQEEFPQKTSQKLTHDLPGSNLKHTKIARRTSCMEVSLPTPPNNYIDC